MKYYKTIGFIFVLALMMLVNGASAQTDKENAVKAAQPAAASAPEIISSPAAALFVSPAAQASGPFQVGRKYLVSSTQSSKFFYILVDEVKGDWVKAKIFEVSAPNKVAGGDMWYNTIYLTSASEM